MNWSYTAAWAAGFFDGEGCVRIETTRHDLPGPLDVQVTQRIVEPLHILRGLHGGHISAGKDGVSRWRVRSKMGAMFLQTIRPYVLVKREQVELALFYQELISRPRIAGSRRSPHVEERREIQRQIADLKRSGK